MPFKLETDRLILRDFRPEDFTAFYETSQDPEYQQFYSQEETRREYWESIFEKILKSAAAEKRTAYQVCICLRSEAIIGTCGVRMEDLDHQQASFGCAVSRSYWGESLAYEAAQRLIKFGFANLPIHRLYAETISENRRARSLAERLGMRLEGELRHTRFFRDRWWNTVIYSILRDDWKSWIGENIS